MNTIAAGFLKNFSQLSNEDKEDVKQKFIGLAKKSVDFIANYFNDRSLNKMNEKLRSGEYQYKNDPYKQGEMTPRNELYQRIHKMFAFEPDVSKKLQFISTMKLLALQKDQTMDEKLNNFQLCSSMENLIKNPGSQQIFGEIKSQGMNLSSAMIILDRLKDCNIFEIGKDNTTELTEIQRNYSGELSKLLNELNGKNNDDVKTSIINKMREASTDKNQSEAERKNAVTTLNFMEDTAQFFPYKKIYMNYFDSLKADKNAEKATQEKIQTPLKFSPELHERIRKSLMIPVDQQNYSQRSESLALNREVQAMRDQRNLEKEFMASQPIADQTRSQKEAERVLLMQKKEGSVTPDSTGPVLTRSQTEEARVIEMLKNNSEKSDNQERQRG